MNASSWSGPVDGGRRLVVMGADGDAVGRRVRELRDGGARVAGFVGEDEELAVAMGVEMLGGVDEVVRLDQ